ncbi:hypothetical protein ACHAXM_011978 [Skeletonema potamos]
MAKEEDHPEEVPFVDYEGEEDDDDDENNTEDHRPPSNIDQGALEAAVATTGAGDSETEDDDDDDDNNDGSNNNEGHPQPPSTDVAGSDERNNGNTQRNKKDTPPSSLMDRPLTAPRYNQPKEQNNNHGDDDDDEERKMMTTKKQQQQQQLQSPREHVGAYIPPAKRRLLEQQQSNHDDDNNNHPNEHKVTPIHIQRQTWETLQRTINGTINRLNITTIKPLIHSLFQKANLIRGRGILIKSILHGVMSSPNYAHIYVALLAVINTKLPECGELLVTRAILAFRKGYQRRDRMMVSSILALLGHLFNQGLTHELLSLQILTILLDGDPTDDSVDVAVGYMCIVGRHLMEVSPAGVHAVMERFRGLLHEGVIGRRGQYRIETLLKIKRGGFVDYPTLPDEEYLDLVEREDQITFELGLDDDGLSNQEQLDVFRFDEDYDENEKEWERIRAEILGEDDSSSGSDNDDDDDESGSESGAEEEDAADRHQQLNDDKKKTVAIQDLTETDLVHLRRTIYLTIMSSATFEECTHKLAKMDIPQGREHELINMIIECCSQERTFLRYYGLVSGRFCLLHERWQDAFQSAFATQYNTIHRLETNKLRNVAKLFGHLLHTDSISWSVLSCIHLNEDETTSSSRIFLKILIQEMAEAMGMVTLKQRFDTDNPNPDGLLVTGGEETAALATITNNANSDAASSREWFKGMFPKDNARNTRYAINFFTSIGLGPLTDGMREFLKNAPKLILAQAQAQAAKKAEQQRDDSDASSVISSSSSDTSSFDSSSSSSFSSSSSSSYTSSSSYSSYSSDSRRKKRSSRRGRDRKRGRSHRSYSTSSSCSDSETSSRRGRRKTSSKRDARQSRSRSSSNGSSGDKKRRSRGKSDVKTPDASKTSSKRSVSQSPAGSRRHRLRSYSSSRSHSRSSGKSNDRRNSRSSENPIHELPAELKDKQSSREKRRRRSSSSSSASQSRSPSKDKKYSRREDRKRRRSRSRSASSGRD